MEYWCAVNGDHDEQGACIIIMVTLDCSWMKAMRWLLVMTRMSLTSQSSSSSSDGSEGEGIPLDSASSDT